MTSTNTKLPAWFWAVSVLLLLWDAAGVCFLRACRIG